MVRLVWFLLTVVLVCLAGCGQGSFVPPRPPELDALPVSAEPEGVGTVAMVVPPAQTLDRLVWVDTAKKYVNRAKAAFILRMPRANDPPSAQAKLILEAAEPGVKALIVEPMDDPEVVAALNTLKSRGLTIVLLNRPVPNADPKTPFGLVSFAPNAAPFQKLAEAAMADAQNLGLPSGGTALILYDSFAPLSEQTRIEDLTQAFKKAGVSKVETFGIDRDPEKAKAAVTERVKNDSSVTILVGTEEISLQVAMMIKQAQTVGRALSVVGTATIELKVNNLIKGTAGLVDLNTPDLAIAAVKLALRMVAGENGPTDVVVPITFLNHAEYAAGPNAPYSPPKQATPSN